MVIGALGFHSLFGPEGCGKSAWLRQAGEVPRKLSYDVIYVNVLHKELAGYSDAREVVKRISTSPRRFRD